MADESYTPLTLNLLQFDHTLIEALPIMVWCDDKEGRNIYVNTAHTSFTGRSREQEEGMGWLELVHPSERDHYIRVYDEARKAERPLEIEYRMRRSDGQYRWVIERGTPVRNEAGKVIGYVGFGIDTTERRETDRVRQEMEEQVRLLGLATRDWVWSWDARTDRIIHNVAFTEALGDAPGPRGATQIWWQQHVHPADVQRVTNAFAEAARTGARDVVSEYRIRLRNGSYAHVEDRVCFVRDTSGEVVRVLGAMRNITVRKRVADAHARFTTILESTSDFVCMTSAGGLLLYVNAAGRTMLGWPAEKPIGAVHISSIHPAWAAEIVFEEAIPTAIRDGTWTGETALLTSEGRELPVSQVIISHHNDEGELEFLSTIIRDISDRKREEVARIEWANRYDAAIRASGQVLFDWNSTTNDITYAGDLYALLGYEGPEMSGGLERLRQIIHEGDLGAFDAEISRVTATRDPFRHSFRARRKDGRIVDMEAKGYFFIDRLGHIGRMVGFLADVTSQRMAERELERAHDSLEARVAKRTEELQRATSVIRERALQTEIVAQLGHRALSGTPLQALLADEPQLVRQTLRVDYVSILELTPDGKELVAIAEAGWPMRDQSRVGVGHESQSGYTLLTGEPVIVEDTAREKRFRVSEAALEAGALSSVSVVIESGHRPLGVLIAFTRKRRKFAQDDVNFLQSMANVLTAAIDRSRAEQSIRSAQEQAEAANRAKSDFLSRMSHELRTPLNAIIGFTQLLEIDSPTASQAESIGHITRAGHHLLSLINEVLDIARIESGRLALTAEPLELSSFLREVVDLIRPLAQRHHVDIVLQPSCNLEQYVKADLQRFKQVLLNLLSNAVKYNRPNGHVTLTCAPHGERLRLSMTDTGLGIPPDKIERLFVPFERLGAETTDIEGTGLGLALSQRIMHALDGELGVQSTMGEGSTFWIDIPLVGAPELPLVNPEPIAARGSSVEQKLKKVLYVEDQDLNLRLVERILNQRPGYKLTTVMQGRLALDIAREHRPDLILLDLNLPDMSGEEILRKLKADPELYSTPVIMVSADAMGDRIEELLKLGADGYLTKPYKLQEFLSVIEEALER
jgi:PAS domain S-box-containing protein